MNTVQALNFDDAPKVEVVTTGDGPKYLKQKGFENIDVVGTFARNYPESNHRTEMSVLFDLIGEKRIAEMRSIFQRALNTWDVPPDWAMEACDLMDKVIEHSSKPIGQ